jgi:hypothetical protein
MEEGKMRRDFKCWILDFEWKRERCGAILNAGFWIFNEREKDAALSIFNF